MTIHEFRRREHAASQAQAARVAAAQRRAESLRRAGFKATVRQDGTVEVRS